MRRCPSPSPGQARSWSRWRPWASAPGTPRLTTGPPGSGVSTIDYTRVMVTWPRVTAGDGEGVPCYVEPPVIAGHEFSGRVVKLGE